MKRVFKTLGWTVLIGLALSALLIMGVIGIGDSLGPDTLIEINGEPIAHAGAINWLVGVGGTLLAMVIVLLVVPVAVLVPLLIVGLLLIGVLLIALAAIAGAAALVLSPLLVLAGVVWLIWRMQRSDAPATGPAADATIAR